MLSTRRQSTRSVSWSQPKSSAMQLRPAAPAKPATAPVRNTLTANATLGTHPLTRGQDNLTLHKYEQSVKDAFDAIVPALKRISAMQHEENFEARAQVIAREQLGYELPAHILADAWIEQLDMRRLFAWAVFETYHRYSDDFFTHDHLILEKDFQQFLIGCGFHTLDVSPCADGRLAHVISYVLRLPYREVRRKSYAGAMFDIEDSLAKWVETELIRFREGRPNTADGSTRYLKAVVYHFSSSDPDHEGCAAHGSDTQRAAQAGLDRLYGFQQAVQNSFCCGASIDLLLIGLNTDNDAIRIHVPDDKGAIALNQFIDAQTVFDETGRLSAQQAEALVLGRVRDVNAHATEGMVRFVTLLITNNLSQIDYVRQFYGERYQDIGHAERFIGAGIGFEEIQLRNLTYFSYMHTVEEATDNMDVGIKIFSKLNVARGLPVPVVVRYDYHGHVPGARERAINNCQRVEDALHMRYRELVEQGLLHTLLVIRDCHANERIEILGSSIDNHTAQGKN